MHIDPLARLPDVDEEANSRAVPLSGRPLMRLLFGDWRTGAIGESEYFQAWVLVWLSVGPLLLALLLLFLTSRIDPFSPICIAIAAALAALLIVVTANLSAKRARGKGLPGWIGPVASLVGWLMLPLSRTGAALLIAAGPIAASAVIDRLAKRRHPTNRP